MNFECKVKKPADRLNKMTEERIETKTTKTTTTKIGTRHSLKMIRENVDVNLLGLLTPVLIRIEHVSMRNAFG